MSKVNLNKISVKQQGGASMMQPIQEQVDPAIQEISQFFANSMEQGGKPEEIVKIKGSYTGEFLKSLI